MLQHLLDAALLDLGIDLLRHDAILLVSEGDGSKPGALQFALKGEAGKALLDRWLS